MERSNKIRPSAFRLIGALLALLTLRAAARAQNLPVDLSQMGLEDLMKIQVTSVSKKEQDLAKTGAAVFVISQEDIRHSGSTNIPDLLRMVPGMDVAQLDRNHWAISIRGFSSVYADKVLVLVDGRSVYRNLFSGVAWDEVDVPLENIDRIEVIRGPGGTVWGANAMNGVINIITMRSDATRGGVVAVASGTGSTGEGLLQYGGAAGAAGSYRVFGKYMDVDNSRFPQGGPAADGWHSFHGGFRSDWTVSSRDTVTVQGDFQQNREGQTLDSLSPAALPGIAPAGDRIQDKSGNVLGRWNRKLANGSDFSLQIYDDYYKRLDEGELASANTVDFDFQHHLQIGSRHDVVWGAGYRQTRDALLAGPTLSYNPGHFTSHLFETFVQDEIRIGNSLSLTAGSKLEHNSFTGFEYEPAAQLVWSFSSKRTLWISAARAIRQPARIDWGVVADTAVVALPNDNYLLARVYGSPAVNTERVHDFEAGYRAQHYANFSVDAVVFLSLYRKLETTDPRTPYFTTAEGPAHFVLPLVFDFLGSARNFGAELSATWQSGRRWKLSPALSFVNIDIRSSAVGYSTPDPANSPRHTVGARSQLKVTRNLDWDVSLSSVGSPGGVPSYTRIDTRVAWRWSDCAEFSVTGQNLLSPGHSEYPDELLILHTQARRDVTGKITWRF